MLLGEAVEDVDELGEALRAIGIAFVDPVRDALLDVELEHDQADPIQRRLGRGELLEDLDAQPGLLDHPPDPSHLTLDAVQPCDDSLLLRLVEHHGPFQYQELSHYRNMSL